MGEIAGEKHCIHAYKQASTVTLVLVSKCLLSSDHPHPKVSITSRALLPRDPHCCSPFHLL